MKVVLLKQPRVMELAERPKPMPKAGDALVRICAVGICGSDMHFYEEGRIGGTRMEGPLVLGHEFSGVVESVGQQGDAALVGRRVAVEPGRPCFVCEWCRAGNYNVCPDMAFPGGPPHDGALCEYVCVPASHCYPIEDRMTMAEAAALEPLSVALYSIDLAELQPGDTVAVLGLGPIGLLIGMAAKVGAASRVFGTDLLEYRVEASLNMGVDESFCVAQNDTVEAIMEATDGRGVDVAVDAARSSETLGLAVKVAKPGGRCVLTGISGKDEDTLPVSDARRRGLRLLWCRRMKHNYPRAIELVSSGQLDLKPILTHTFPLEEAHEAFEMVSYARDGVLKATIAVSAE